MSVVFFFCANSRNQSWQVWVSLRGNTKMAVSKMAIEIQDGYHHQINQIELVWVRVGVEWECFWVNLWEDNKVSESKMACQCLNPRWQNSRWLTSSSFEWRWMSLSQIELVWVRVLCKMAESKFVTLNCKIVESKMAEFKMDAIIKLGKNEWVWVRLN